MRLLLQTGLPLGEAAGPEDDVKTRRVFDFSTPEGLQLYWNFLEHVCTSKYALLPIVQAAVAALSGSPRPWSMLGIRCHELEACDFHIGGSHVRLYRP